MFEITTRRLTWVTVTCCVLLIGALTAGPALGTTEVKLHAAETDRGHLFGDAVAISGDRLVVGAPGAAAAGRAYVFEFNSGWTETAVLAASDSDSLGRFGDAVAVDSDRIVIGARTNNLHGVAAGAAYLFEHDGMGNWVETRLDPSDPAAGEDFGWSVAVAGDRIVVGAVSDDNENGVDAGAAFVFEPNGRGGWMQTAKLTASDGHQGAVFGISVAVDGDVILVGSQGQFNTLSAQGAVYLFEPEGSGGWVETAKLIDSDQQAANAFGSSVAIDGSRIVVGAFGNQIRTGAAYVFEPNGAGGWEQVAKLTANDGNPDDEMGRTVDLSGDRIVAAAPGDDGDIGAVYLYERDASASWLETKMIASDGADDDRFGESTAMDGSTLVVGAPLDDDRGVTSGSVYVVDTMPNAPPIADPGGNYDANEGEDIVLDGTGSFDPDGDTLQNIEWSVGGLPISDSLTPTIPALAAARFLPLDTAIEVTLTVGDGLVEVTSEPTTLTINNVPPDLAPIDDQVLTLGSELVLDDLTFTDALPILLGSPIEDLFPGTVDWGDGAVEVLTSRYFDDGTGELLVSIGAEDEFASHTYTAGGFPEAEVCVIDAKNPMIDDCETFTVTVIIPVGVDVKPGSDPNSIDANGNGVIPVAILGSDTFDVTQIDVSTLSFAGLEVRVKGNGTPQCAMEDVSGDFTDPEGAADGHPDLVCQFVDDPDNWMPGVGDAVVTGNLVAEFGGAPFAGEDTINIVP